VGRSRTAKRCTLLPHCVGFSRLLCAPDSEPFFFHPTPKRPTVPPASCGNNDPKAATRAKRLLNPVPTSVLPGRNDESRQVERGISDEKDSHTARRRDPAIGCRPGHCHKLLRAVSHDAKREYPHNNANLRRRDSAWLQFPIRHDVERERVDPSPSDRHLLQLRHRRCVSDSTLGPFFCPWSSFRPW
jgi:hypothetical protein